MTPWAGALLAAALTAPLVTGCSAGAADEHTLTVLAAASLAEPFAALEAEFERSNPGTEVRVVLGSSATLAMQVLEGAPADVVATADRRTMRTVVVGGATPGAPVHFAWNRMVLAVPDDNPAGVDGIGDLARDGVFYVTCVPSAPCGAIAEALLSENRITRDPASYETDVTAVLTKVASGEADAGLVYASDTGRAEVDAIEIPGAGDHRNPYLLATVDRAAAPELAEAWVELVLSQRGRRALADAGFSLPREEP